MQRKHSHNRFNRYTRMLLVYIAILLVPVLLIETVNFSVMRQQNYDILAANIRASSENQLTYLNGQFKVLSTAIAQIRKDKNFYYKYRSESTASFFEIRQSLEESNVWSSFFSDVLYYDRQDGSIISNRGKEPEDFFSTNIITIQDIDRANSFIDGLGILNAVDIRMNNQNCILVAAPIERVYTQGSYTGVRSLILFQIPCSVFSDVIAPDGMEINEYRLAVYYNGQPVGVNSPALYQSMYAGDAIDLNDGEGYFYSFEEGGFRIDWSIPKDLYNSSLISMVLTQAIVVFLILSIAIAVIYRFTQRSFQPLKMILQNIPDEYSSNSVKFSDEFKYLDFVLGDLIYAKSIFKESRAQMRQEQYLYYIIDNQVQKESALYKQCLEDGGIRLDRQRFLCVLVPDLMENHQVYQYFTEGFSKYKEHSDIYSLYILGDKYMFLICSDLESDQLTGMLRNDLAQWNEVEIGMGSVVDHLDKIRSSYAQARAALDSKEPEGYKVYPQVEMEALSEAVSAGNTAKIEFALRIMKNDMPYLNTIVRSAVLIDVAALLLGGDRDAAFQAVQDAEYLSDEYMCRKLDSLLAEYIKTQETPEQKKPKKAEWRRNLKDIVKYVEENCCSQGFSVKGMAADFNTTPSNLSHYFKNSTGQTLSQYIEEYRMSKAREMLAAQHKVGEVAERLGFSSSTAFSDAFKKYHGKTPQAFRSEVRTKPDSDDRVE